MATVFLLFIVSVWVCQFKCVSCFQNTTSLKLNCTPCQGQIFYFVAGNMRSASLSFTIPFSGYIPVVIYL